LALPQGLATEPPLEIELHYHYDDLSPMVGAPYVITFEDGTKRQGTLDSDGYALLSGVPKGAYKIEYGEDSRDWQAPPPEPDDAEFAKRDVQQQGAQAIEKMLAKQAPIGDTSEGSAGVVA
jgi:type VI secretion system secreted protein VgrG